MLAEADEPSSVLECELYRRQVQLHAARPTAMQIHLLVHTAGVGENWLRRSSKICLHNKDEKMEQGIFYFYFFPCDPLVQ